MISQTYQLATLKILRVVKIVIVQKLILTKKQIQVLLVVNYSSVNFEATFQIQ